MLKKMLRKAKGTSMNLNQVYDETLTDMERQNISDFEHLE